MELSTQHPTSVKSRGESGWKVRREWRYAIESYSWVAIRPNGRSGEVFPTWRAAMDFVDRQARTVKVILPRVKKYGKQKVAGTGLTSLHVDYRPFATAIYLGGWGDLIIENADLEPLVMHLLARIHARKC